jgi:hypothetical protein
LKRETLTVTRAAIAETVKVKLAAKVRTDTLVQVVSDTQVVIRETPAAPPETVVVAPRIVGRITACDAFASSCQRQLSADSALIAGLRHQINVTPKPQKCGRKCGATLGFLAGLLIHKAAR